MLGQPRSNYLQPSQLEHARDCRIWDFGFENVVKDMFQNPEFRRRYRESRRYDDVTSYFASDAFKAYDEAAGGKVVKNRPADFAPTAMFEFGGDGVSLLIFAQRTAIVIGVRCEEVEGEGSQSQLNWRPLIVIEGPLEKQVLHQILSDTVNQLRARAPFQSEGASPRQMYLTAGVDVIISWGPGSIR